MVYDGPGPDEHPNNISVAASRRAKQRRVPTTIQHIGIDARSQESLYHRKARSSGGKVD